MIWSLASCIKINLTLRIVGVREDGYHRLVSIFKKLPSVERLSLEVLPQGSGDRVVMPGLEISDINLVQRVIDFTRERGVPVPPLSVSIDKVIPPGTGLGAGTGNGAAVFRWISRYLGLSSDHDLSSLGADLPFMASDASLAMVSGIGESFSVLDDVPLRSVVIVPSWRCNTSQSYRALDQLYSHGSWPLSEADGEREALDILDRLRSGNRVGLLPNDFIVPLVDIHPGYGEMFNRCESSGALAWGMSGSGSSVFALFSWDTPLSGFFDAFNGLKQVEKIIFLE